MSQFSATDQEWLTLSEAARRLNVHPTTLRRWADNGDIAVMLTPGGHRRFGATDVARFAQSRRSLSRPNEISAVWAEQALTQTRSEIVVHRQEGWLTRFDDESRQQNRQLGQQLMGLTLQFLSDEQGNGEILKEAKKIGQQYAQNSLAMGLPLAEVLQAAIFFRDMLVETAMQLPENLNISPNANLRLLRRINQLLNVVHLAIAEVYDAPESRLSRR